MLVLEKPTVEVFPGAERFLARLGSDWEELVERMGSCAHRAHPTREPYEALVRAIAYQQLHAKAGDAILGRLTGHFLQAAFPAPEQLLGLGFEEMRGCGFSASKTAAIRGIAQATIDGVIPSRSLADSLDDRQLTERLLPLKGIGQWTIEMFLIYTMERPDILPVDDFGVREGYRLLKGLAQALTPKALKEIGSAWSPFRTAATWYLWRRAAEQ